jgi:hypothetical protein
MSIYTWVSGSLSDRAFIVGTISQWWGVSAAFLWNGTLGLVAVASARPLVALPARLTAIVYFR